ncbi:BatA domain-containing protein [Gemmata sp. SH-PL17]|uniref:BatA domain-containing protein n=1 Tax=Gemmata sp. SH-PL17 TaxID=1630693 RepID=UPI0009EF5499
MLSFTTPEFLWLSPLALVVAWWWRRRRRPALRFSDVSGFGNHTGRRASFAAWGGPVLRGLACLCLVVACAGPAGRTRARRSRPKGSRS